MVTLVEQFGGSSNTPRIRREGDQILISEWMITDPYILSYVGNKNDEEVAGLLIDALRLGARLLQLGETLGAVEVVRSELERVPRAIATANERVQEEARQRLTQSLDAFANGQLQPLLQSVRVSVLDPGDDPSH